MKFRKIFFGALLFATVAPSFALTRVPFVPEPLDSNPNESTRALSSNVVPAIESKDGCFFDAAGAAAEKSRLALLVFSRRDCPACVAAKPDVEKIRRAGIRTVEVDVQTPTGAQSAANYRVRSVPAFFLIRYEAGSTENATVDARIDATASASAFVALFNAFEQETKKIDAAHTRCVVVPASSYAPDANFSAGSANGIDAKKEPAETSEPDPADVEPSLNETFNVEVAKSEKEETNAPDESTDAEDFRNRADVRDATRPGILDRRRDGRDTPSVPDVADETGLANRFGVAIASAVKKALEDKLDETKKSVDAAKNRIAAKLFFLFLGIQVIAGFLTDVATRATAAILNATRGLFGGLAKRARQSAIDYLTRSETQNNKAETKEK